MSRDADPVEVQKRLDAGESYTVRFKVPKGAVITIQDIVRGEVSWDAEATLGDFIILRLVFALKHILCNPSHTHLPMNLITSRHGTSRSNGMPVYNFCVAVDDAKMQISHVIRAEEHLTNTLRQVTATKYILKIINQERSYLTCILFFLTSSSYYFSTVCDSFLLLYCLRFVYCLWFVSTSLLSAIHIETDSRCSGVPSSNLRTCLFDSRTGSLEAEQEAWRDLCAAVQWAGFLAKCHDELSREIRFCIIMCMGWASFLEKDFLFNLSPLSSLLSLW